MRFPLFSSDSVGDWGALTDFQNYSLSTFEFEPKLSDMGKTLRCQVDSDYIRLMQNDDQDQEVGMTSQTLVS